MRTFSCTEKSIETRFRKIPSSTDYFPFLGRIKVVSKGVMDVTGVQTRDQVGTTVCIGMYRKEVLKQIG